jgi:zinc protease
VERYFGVIPAAGGFPPFTPPDAGEHLGGEVREVVRDRVPLERVHVGFRMPPYGTPEHDAMEVAAQILAGGKGSRLHRRLVRDERIAQDVVAFTLPLVSGSAIFAGWVTARPDVDVATAEAAFFEELDRLVREPVTDDELVRAHALIESSEMAALGRVDEVADRLSMYATYFDRPELINEQLPRYLAVDAAAIQQAAERVFRADNRAVIAYVPQTAEDAA